MKDRKKYFKFNCSSVKSRNTQVEQIHPVSHFFIWKRKIYIYCREGIYFNYAGCLAKLREGKYKKMKENNNI